MPLVLPKPGDAQKAGQRRAAEMSWQGKLQKKSEEHRTPLQQYAAAHTAQQQTDASSLLGNQGKDTGNSAQLEQCKLQQRRHSAPQASVHS